MTSEHRDSLDLIAHYLSERHRGHLLGKSPYVASVARTAYAAGIRDMTREILVAFSLEFRKALPEIPLTFEPAPVAVATEAESHGT